MPSALLRSTDYSLGEILAKTCFGRVQKARNNTTGDFVVVKISNRTLIYNSRADTIEDPVQEVRFLEHLQALRQTDNGPGSKTFVNLLDNFQDATHDWTVLEYATQGDMFEMVKQGGMEDKQQTVEAFRQLIDGVQYLHKHKIAHRDLSLENFFVAKDGSIKIGDFGQAKFVETDSEGNAKFLDKLGSSCPGKSGYQAPEIHDNVPYDPYAADVFALGVSLFVALAKIPPFNRADRHDKCWKFVKQGNLVKLINAWKLDIDEQTQDLLQGMLNPAGERLTLAQVRSHVFFESADEVMAG